MVDHDLEPTPEPPMKVWTKGRVVLTRRTPEEYRAGKTQPPFPLRLQLDTIKWTDVFGEEPRLPPFGQHDDRLAVPVLGDELELHDLVRPGVEETKVGLGPDSRVRDPDHIFVLGSAEVEHADPLFDRVADPGRIVDRPNLLLGLGRGQRDAREDHDNGEDNETRHGF